MPYAIANGRKIWYVLINEQFRNEQTPFLVFLHEGLGSIPQWREFPAILSAELNMPAMLYERYGYGRSEGPKELPMNDYMQEEGERALPSLLDKLGINEKLFLYGHSDGATIALIFASLFPERVIGLVSEAAHVFLEDASLTGISQTLKKFETTILKDFLKIYHGKNTEGMFYGWALTWLSPIMQAWNITSHLKTISAPVLAIQGDTDAFGTEAQLDAIISNVGGYSEKHSIAKCGHAAHEEQTELVVGLVRNFAERNTIISTYQ